jgi:hypothetical protein
MSDAGAGGNPSDPSQEGGRPEGVPEWEDGYLDRVADRLFVNYDLERDYPVRSVPVAPPAPDRFDLYGEMRMESRKQFLHPSITYGRHYSREFLFVARAPPTVERFEALVDLGHALADDRVEADEEHYGTDFTFVLVGDRVPEEVTTFVEGFSDRTLLKYGYNGHYEIHLAAVAPDEERYVESARAEMADAFRLWRSASAASGPLARLRRLLFE